MIVPAEAVRVVIATRPVDFRRGHDSLAALAQHQLGLDPHSGVIMVFRSKRGDRIKILVFDGSGLVLHYPASFTAGGGDRSAAGSGGSAAGRG